MKKRPVQPKRRTPRPRRAESSAAGAIELHIDHGCLTATIAAPPANRLNSRMAHELLELAETIEDDDTILCFALTGGGAIFCAGFDDSLDPRLVEALAAISKPTIALLNGDARDEGLELALACDIRVTHRGAAFALTQLQRGMLPHFGGTQRLPRLVGPAQALRMLLTGDPLDAKSALRLGLVTYLADGPEDLQRVSRDLAATLVSRGPLGVRMVKDAVLKGYDMTLEQGIRLEEDLYALLQTSADRAEGVRAFLERRKPLFKGA